MIVCLAGAFDIHAPMLAPGLGIAPWHLRPLQLLLEVLIYPWCPSVAIRYILAAHQSIDQWSAPSMHL